MHADYEDSVSESVPSRVWSHLLTLLPWLPLLKFFKDPLTQKYEAGTVVVPALSTITPSLGSLALGSNHDGKSLDSMEDIDCLVQGLREGYCGLETLCLCVNRLSFASLGLGILHASGKLPRLWN